MPSPSSDEEEISLMELSKHARSPKEKRPSSKERSSEGPSAKKAKRESESRKSKEKEKEKEKKKDLAAYQDEDESMPISEFVARVKQELQDKERKKKEKETKKPDKEKETKQRKSVESSSSGATGTRTSKPRAVNRSSDSDVVTKWGTLRDTTKGSLINRLLCRWKYIRTWPDADALQGPPMDHLEMEGFPGVYVCVKGDNIGRIMDVRDSKSCPNFKNMLKKSSSELQKLLIKALKAQREEFVQHWGEGKPYEREIKKELRWAKDVKPDDSDKEAKEALGKIKFS